MSDITTDDGTIDLAALTRALDAVRTRIHPDNTDDDIDSAIAKTRSMLAMVAEPVASFVNDLDDGNGASNSTSDFAEILAEGLDEAHRFGLVLALGRSMNQATWETARDTVDLFRKPLVDDED